MSTNFQFDNIIIRLNFISLIIVVAADVQHLPGNSTGAAIYFDSSMILNTNCDLFVDGIV